MSNSLVDFAMKMIRSNPRVANNPRAQDMISVIQNGDSERGEKIAENLCQTYGVTKEQALTDAKKFFNIR